MATPHVAGLAAYLGALNGASMTPAAMKSKIQSLATSGAVALPLTVRGTPNSLAFNGFA